MQKGGGNLRCLESKIFLWEFQPVFSGGKTPGNYSSFLTGLLNIIFPLKGICCYKQSHPNREIMVIFPDDKPLDSPENAGISPEMENAARKCICIKMEPSVFHFDDTDPPPQLKTLGGKGYSLVKMDRSGLLIPPGFVLSVAYFEPWVDQLKQTEVWRQFLAASSEEMQGMALALQEAGKKLEFTEDQIRQLEEALGRYDFKFFAVRSSSPEEDLEGASFAGGYETILGVDRANMKTAILKAFCSCLHPRVFVYKRQQGFDIDDFRIAVVVQSQVDSEIAGVGFSVNPINNDYDEAMFNSNWGLGETVVAGLASPDQITVNKLSKKIIDFQVGQKETSIWLAADGGTEEHSDPRHGERTLTDEQASELTDQLYKIEKLYGRPMDIEWAYSGGQLFLLQARPVTTHLNLPPAIITRPGQPRRLYLDITLTVQGLVEPMSVLGTDFIRRLLKKFFSKLFGTEQALDVETGLVCVEGGRIYLNLSNGLHLFGSFEKFANVFQKMDFLSAGILRNVDESAYKSTNHPGPIKKLNPKAILSKPDIIYQVLEEAFTPERHARSYRRAVKKTFKTICRLETENLPLGKYFDGVIKETLHLLIRMALPTFTFSQVAIGMIKKIFAGDAAHDDNIRDQLDRIDKSLPHNITVEMGLNLHKISQLLESSDFNSRDEFFARFHEGLLPESFNKAWQEFIDRFGFRGPGEFDIAAPRYSDHPESILSQIYSMMQSGQDKENPQERYDRYQEERRQAYDGLLKIARSKGWIKAALFKRLYRVVEEFGGYREHHKYYLIRSTGFLRTRVLRIGKELVAAGRLDKPEQAFDLTINELDRCAAEPELDLCSAAAANNVFISQIKNRGDLPAIVDSRGRIFRPKTPELEDGDLGGLPVSTGVVRGKVKVLHSPDEKPLLPGEILVARATDPGWTPLFVPAAAIVLEVGGVLQHGALVAREYGKPCVVGIANATKELKDGDYVEVDGTAGLIRRNIIDDGTQT